MMKRCFKFAAAAFVALWIAKAPARAETPIGDEAARKPGDPPAISDARLKLELFANSPQISTPIGLTVDLRGRVLVVESHTHFRSDKDDGPPVDRIKLLIDSAGSGKADRVVTFHEGFRYAMNLAAGADGWIYCSTRSAIFRLKDSDGDDKADVVEKIVTLASPEVHPHNGLDGLAIDAAGMIHFGLGENLGEKYAVVGSDGVKFAGGAEGGSAYLCKPDGTALRRVATGFWNPFGMTIDPYGRWFATDNDPNSRPPNRLLHIVPGADFGFQYQYGRSGMHPFDAWEGELPGTLGMMTGIGEAACNLLRYESDGLPDEYRNELLLCSWADHRVERYHLEPKGATFAAQRVQFISGGGDFRPVGMALGHDGSLYFSDWVTGTYSTHPEGRVWHVRWPNAAPQRPTDPELAVHVIDQRTREAGARTLASTPAGRQSLQNLLDSTSDVGLRATALSALINAGEMSLPLAHLVSNDPSSGVRLIAARAMNERAIDAGPLLSAILPGEVRAEVLGKLDPVRYRDALLSAATDPDPSIRNAATLGLSREPSALMTLDWKKLPQPAQRNAVQLALKWSGLAEARKRVGDFLSDPDEAVRFTALKWIADERLKDYRSRVLIGLDAPDLGQELFVAYVSALDRLDHATVSDTPDPAFLSKRALDDRAAAGSRRMSLALLRPDAKGLTLKQIEPLLRHADAGVRREAVRLVAALADPARFALLAGVASDAKRATDERADALVGLAVDADQHLPLLTELAAGGNAILRDEALRALPGTMLPEAQKETLRQIAHQSPTVADAVARAVGDPRPARPDPKETASWLTLLEGSSDREAGRRIFSNLKVGSCIQCHSMDGRGNRVGPDLSRARNDRHWLLQSILEPSREMAPQFVPWQVKTHDGEIFVGFTMTKGGEKEVYADVTGKKVTFQKKDIVSVRQMTVSLMPEGLAQGLTLQELRDVLAFLEGRN